MMGIKKTTNFQRLLLRTEPKAALFRSFTYGAIFNTELTKKMEKDCPHFMIPMNELVEDHKELKESTTDNDDLSDYYVFSTFMPPGDNKVIVSSESIEDEDSYFLCESIVPIRTEEVNLAF